MWSYLERLGRPVEFYTDKGSVFRVHTPQRQGADEVWPEARTQIGRALKELGIGWIAAHSPQAKGRIERFFGTAQDRLVKGLRIARATTIEAANDYLEKAYLAHWSERFTVGPARAVDAHRPLQPEHDLAAILSQVEERVVTNDYTLRYGGQFYQVARTDIRPGLRGGTVRVERRLDGGVWVRFRERYLSVTRCEARPRPASAEKRPKKPSVPGKGQPTRVWMNHFNLRQGPPVWKVLQQEESGNPDGAAPLGANLSRPTGSFR